MRSLLGALSKILNLINPEMQYHHEQTAYLAYLIAKELGFGEEELYFVLNAALLHDIGDVALLPQGQKGFKEEETLEERQRVARIGANMLFILSGPVECSGMEYHSTVLLTAYG